MIYFLKKSTPSSKGLYLQIYANFYDPRTKKKNTKSYKALGYVSDLKKQGIEDPVAFFSQEVKRMNEGLRQEKERQIGEISLSYRLGHFLVKAMFDLLSMDGDLSVVGSTLRTRYSFPEMVRHLCYAQILSPGSKQKAFEKVIPSIYGAPDLSYDQILDAVRFIGNDYHKYVEVLNRHIESKWGRNTEKVYFDCTNYYFEMDLESSFLKKGPSKENRRCPLMGHALLLDGEQIPLDTHFFPGNESEKPYLRERIEDMKNRNNVKGKVIAVADKGLNCARNIYAAVKEANDGYIFSKSVKSLPAAERELALQEDTKLNRWQDVRDAEGSLIYRFKTINSYGKGERTLPYAEYEYSCRLSPDDSRETAFRVKEMRIVSYNPALARKQRAEIDREVDKLTAMMTYRTAIKEDLGDRAKYANLEAMDKDGQKVKIVASLNTDKIEEDRRCAGYTLIVTSEINADPQEIYRVYHNLWRIEESFRIMKSYLEARPVFLSNEDSIKGHFLICYLSLTLLRLLELKVFNDEIPASKLIEFMRQYRVTLNRDGTYINTSTASRTYQAIKEKLGLSKLGNVYLSERDVNLLLKTELE